MLKCDEQTVAVFCDDFKVVCLCKAKVTVRWYKVGNKHTMRAYCLLKCTSGPTIHWHQVCKAAFGHQLLLSCG